jgi:hypothetical protein
MSVHVYASSDPVAAFGSVHCVQSCFYSFYSRSHSSVLKISAYSSSQCTQDLRALKISVNSRSQCTQDLSVLNKSVYPRLKKGFHCTTMFHGHLLTAALLLAADHLQPHSPHQCIMHRKQPMITGGIFSGF